MVEGLNIPEPQCHPAVRTRERSSEQRPRGQDDAYIFAGLLSKDEDTGSGVLKQHSKWWLRTQA